MQRRQRTESPVAVFTLRSSNSTTTTTSSSSSIIDRNPSPGTPPTSHPSSHVALDIDTKSPLPDHALLHLTARGHLEPRLTNVPRRRPSRAHKDRERIQQRCLQEFITGSKVWIALTPRSDYEHDWMWSDSYGFTGVIRVREGRSRYGYCRKMAREGEEEAEEMELVIDHSKATLYNDSGISALTDSQLEDAASFLAHHCRRKADGSGKVLVTVPLSRPAEALSIALFALSLPSTSSPSPAYSPSYLSQIRFLPGILELEQCQDPHSNYTLIQLALWHLHDADVDGLKQEWRGVLSFDGIQRLENLLMSG